MKTRIAISVLLFFLVTGCGASSANKPVIKLGEELQLGYQQSATLAQGGFTVTFKTLVEDSRCPEGTNCVWAGNAKVVITVMGTDATLNTNGSPREVSLSGYKIQLLDVSPHPKLNQQQAPETYSINLIVTKE